MIALVILAAIVLLIVFIGCLTVSVEVGFSELTLRWGIRLGGIRLLSSDRKPARQKPDDVRTAAPKEPKPKRKLPAPEALRLYAELFLKIFQRFLKRLSVDTLRVHFRSAFDDPYDTAMAYGYAGTAMETVQRIADGHIRTLDLHTELDFDSEEPDLDFFLRVSTPLFVCLKTFLALKNGMTAIRRQLESNAKENKHVESTDQ